MVLMFSPQTARRDGATSTGWSSSRRRSSSSGPAAASTAPPGGPARHGTTNMDTLVADRHDRGLGLQRRRDALARRRSTRPGSQPETYFDSSTIIIGLVLLGRWLEARAKGRTTGAIRRLVGLQPDDGPDRRRRRGPRRPARGGPCRRPPARPARRPRPGRRDRASRAARRRRVDADRRADAGRGRPGRRGHRRDRQHDRHVRHAGDARRARHGAGPDRRARPARPGLARRRSSASPTGSARCSCRSCSSLAAVTFVVWFVARPGAAADARADRVHRRR